MVINLYAVLLDQETKKAIKSLRRIKAAGLDCAITPKTLKDRDETVVYIDKMPPVLWITNLIVHQRRVTSP